MWKLSFFLYLFIPSFLLSHTPLIIKFYITDNYKEFTYSYKVYSSLLSQKDQTKIIIVFDKQKYDKATVSKDFSFTQNTEVAFNTYSSQIEGLNDLSFVKDSYDMILYALPNFYPTEKDYDDVIISTMKATDPDFKGILHFRSDAKDEVNMLPVVGNKYLQPNQKLYSNEYSSYFYDFEMTLIAKVKGLDYFKPLHLFRYLPDKKAIELQWTFTDIRYAPFDKTLSKDFETLLERFCSGFDLALKKEKTPLTLSTSLLFPPNPTLRWSILIPTVFSRKDKFHHLLSSLVYQMLVTQTSSDIEIVFCLDNCDMVLGDKRNLLLQQAQGDYINFIDDDDEVSLDYIFSLYQRMESQPDFIEIVVLKENAPLQYKYHYLGKSGLSRSKRQQFNICYFSHLNPVKRSIALQAQFPSKNYGEDIDWAQSVLKTKLLKSSSSFDKPCYFYHFHPLTSLTFGDNSSS